jgi:hypothetical protein
VLMTTSSRVSRYKNLPSGSVLEIELNRERFAYICVALDFYYWLFDFVTNRPLRDYSLLTTRRWKLPFHLWDQPLREWRIVAVLSLSANESKVPPMWVEVSPGEMHYDTPTKYQVFNPGTDSPYDPYDYVAESDLKSYHPSRQTKTASLQEFIAKFLPEMERIEVPETPKSQGTLSEINLHPAQADPDPVLIEVHFYNTPESSGMTPDAIAEELDDALAEHDLGLMVTVDSGIGDYNSEFEVVLEITPRRLRGALAQIRKTLKRLKAPPTTRIIEVADTGNIEHPLVAPAKGK